MANDGAAPPPKSSRRSIMLASLILGGAYASIYWLSQGIRDTENLPVVAASIGLGLTLVSLSIVDWRTLLLPDVITLPLIVAGLIWHLTFSQSVMGYALGAAIGYGVIWGIGRLWTHYRGEAGIGLGDAKLLAAGGAWLGATALPLVLTLASGLGLALIALQRVRGNGESSPIVAFGPYLAIAIWLVWCARP